MRDKNINWNEYDNPIALIYLKVGDLKEGTFYEFMVQAANLAGVGLPSAPSAPMKCEAWTMEEPGTRLIIFSYCQMKYKYNIVSLLSNIQLH